MPPVGRPARHRAATVAICVVAVAAMLALHAHGIAARAYPDMDDRLRLVEVRDWLAGQRFRDVTQYRLNPPAGAPMHWSRLVDMPLAAVMLLVRPLAGDGGAELAAAIVVPLATLAAMLLATGGIARRLAGDAAGLAATALALFAIPATMQAQPLRVDHHGWEIVCALAAVLGVLDRRAGRGGLIAGAALVIGLQISLELLPFAVAVAGVLGLRWCAAPSAGRVPVQAFAAMLAGGETLLFLALHAPADRAGACDAISPPHLAALALAAAGIGLATALAPRAAAARLAMLAVTGGVALLAFHALPPRCGADAFSALEPIVRVYWYDQVKEGLPLWRQTPLTMVETIGFPAIGIACAVVAIRVERAARAPWATYLALLIAAAAVAVMVERAGGLANALAVPAAAWAMLRLGARARADRRAAVRTLGPVAAVLALSPIAPAAAMLFLLPPPASSAGGPACDATAALRGLASVPTGTMLAPLDIGPGILLDTPHAVLASAHHRNHEAIADELRAWLGGDARAHGILRRHRIGYVVWCDMPEMALYRTAAPHGFAAHLAHGQVPAWLAPVAAPAPLRLWRVVG